MNPTHLAYNSNRESESPIADKYWEEYHFAKKAALRMAAKLSAREKHLVVVATCRDLLDTVRHDHTRQRRFERKFLSLEFPKDDGLPYDYHFGNREVNRLVRHLDEPHREHQRKLRLWKALYRLRGRPELQTTLRAICRLRHRPSIIAELGISNETYRRRFCDITALLRLDIAPPESCGE